MTSAIRTEAALFCDAMRVRGHSKASLQHKTLALERFAAWCAERDVMHPVDVTRPLMERYQRFLFEYRRDDDTGLTLATQVNHLVVLRLFFRWLVRQGRMLHNPAADLDLPRLPQHLPSAVLTAEETETILAVPDVSTWVGLRNRAMLEVLYSTAVRRSELTHVQVQDLDFERGTMMVRQGKGRKDRVVPLGERAKSWVKRYLDEARPHLVTGEDPGWLFVSERGGGQLFKGWATRLVRRTIEASGVDKPGACHLFRHTAATLMLEHGADIRCIQHILGHAKLSTTAIYTRVAIGRLVEVHAATHPGARLQEEEENGQAGGDKDPA